MGAIEISAYPSLLNAIVNMPAVTSERVERLKLRSGGYSEYDRANKVNSAMYLALVAQSFEGHTLSIDGTQVAKDEAIRGFIFSSFPETLKLALITAIEWLDNAPEGALHPTPFERAQVAMMKQQAKARGYLDE